MLQGSSSELLKSNLQRKDEILHNIYKYFYNFGIHFDLVQNLKLECLKKMITPSPHLIN